MGVHATNVIDIMNSKEIEQQPIFCPPQESLSPIVEENELESSGSTAKQPDLPQIMVTDVSEFKSLVVALLLLQIVLR